MTDAQPRATSPGFVAASTVLASITSAHIRRDWLIARSYRLAFVLETFGVVASLLLFYFVGEIVDSGGGAATAGLEAGYFSFVVLGLTVLQIGQSTLTAFSHNLRHEQVTGTLEALLATPQPPWVTILASSAYDLLYATASATALVIVGILLGITLEVTAASLVGLVLALPLIVGLYTATGIIVAAFTLIFKQTDALMGPLGTAIGLSSAVYFPLTVLPRPLEFIAYMSPFTWCTQILRACLLDGVIEWSLLLLLAGTTVVLVPASLITFRRSVDHARRGPGLGTY